MSEFNSAEKRFFEFIQMSLRSGATEITVPASLIVHVREEVLQEMRSLCTLSGARITEVDARE